MYRGTTFSSPTEKLLVGFRKLKWSEECQRAFDTLWQALMEAPILIPQPCFTFCFLILPDASNVGVESGLS